MDSFDVIVIGGGPAGMIAAARAARCGAKVVLLDKNKELGRKLMLTGRGRCNFAHDEPDMERLAEAYGDGASFIKPALAAFGLEKTLSFFAQRGVKIGHERGKRIYPADDQDAKTLLQALRRELRDRGVLILGSTEVRSLDIMGGRARRVMTHRGEINGRAFIVATGGMSFSMTGCSGDGYRWARKAGCSVVEPRPAICPIKVSEGFCADMGALKLKNVRLTLIHQGEEVATRFGEMDFAPFGISGATAMDLADTIGQCLTKGGSLSLSIDLKPALDPERLDARIARDFETIGETPLRFALRKMLPKELIPVILRRCGLSEGLPCGETPADQREALRDAIKNFTVTPTGLMGFRFAIVTAGGVSRGDIDEHTLATRKVPNLFFAGEVLDINGPTGGYNLQACWSTGMLAGQSAASYLDFEVPVEEELPPTPQPLSQQSPHRTPRPERPTAPRRTENRDECRKHTEGGRRDGKPSFRKESPASKGTDRPRRESSPKEAPQRNRKPFSSSAQQNREDTVGHRRDDKKPSRRDTQERHEKPRGKAFTPKEGFAKREKPRNDQNNVDRPKRNETSKPRRDHETSKPRRDMERKGQRPQQGATDETVKGRRTPPKAATSTRPPKRDSRSTTTDFAGWKGFSKKKGSSTSRPPKKEE